MKNDWLDWLMYASAGLLLIAAAGAAFTYFSRPPRDLPPVALTTPTSQPTPPDDPDPQPSAPAAQSSPQERLLNGCVIDAMGRLPKVDGLRVLNSSYEYRNSHEKFEFWNIFLSVSVDGREANYHWLCRIYANTSSELLRPR